MAKTKFSQKCGLAKDKCVGIVKDFIKYWKVPKDGDYVSNKEFSYFILGTSGNNSFAWFMGYIGFGSGCLLVTAIYEIAFLDFTIIATLGIPLSYLFTPINMLITDNLGSLPKKSAIFVYISCILCTIAGIACYFVPYTAFEGILSGALPRILGNILLTSVFNVFYRILVLKKLSKIFGKFRSWIVAGLIPTMIMYALIVYLPFDIPVSQAGAIDYATKLTILHLLFSLMGTFNSFSGQVGNMQNVISPNTVERTKIMALGSFAYSLLPSLCGMFVPLLAVLIGGKDSFANIKVYRILFPIFMVIFGIMTLVLAFKVKERVIIEKEHKPQISFKKGSIAVLKNKYFWISTLSGLFTCITAGSIGTLNIFFLYTTRQMEISGIYTTIVGLSYTPGMILAPWLIKKLGKRNMLYLQKIASMLSIVGSYFAVISGSTFLFILVNFVATLFISPTSIATQSMGADQWDYQQYLTGERLDGFSGIFGLILLPLTTIGGFLIPALYKGMGFSGGDMDIMYIPDMREKILLITSIIGFIATLLSAIPYIFYNLTEKRHAEIIEILKERAATAETQNGAEEFPSGGGDGDGGNDNGDGEGENSFEPSLAN